MRYWHILLDRPEGLFAFLISHKQFVFIADRNLLYSAAQPRRMAIVKIWTMFANTVVASYNVYNLGVYMGYNIGCTPSTGLI